MEAETAFVRADGAIELNAEAAVHLRFAAMVRPKAPERDDAFRLDYSL